MEKTKYDVFISYSRKDYVDEQKNVIPGNEVSKIKEALSKAGISFWFDEEGIYSGQNLVKTIISNIENSKVFLFLSTANANKSQWICKEVCYAADLKKHIIPVRIDSSPYNDSFKLLFSKRDNIDYYANPQKGMEDMMKSILNILNEEWNKEEIMENAIEWSQRNRGEYAVEPEEKRKRACLREQLLCEERDISSQIEETKRELLIKEDELKKDIHNKRTEIDILRRKTDGEDSYERRKRRIVYFIEQIESSSMRWELWESIKRNMSSHPDTSSILHSCGTVPHYSVLAYILKGKAEQEKVRHALLNYLDDLHCEERNYISRLKTLEEREQSLMEEIRDLERHREERLRHLETDKLRVEKQINALQEADTVFSSVFAPAEVKRKSHMLVQVYLHLLEESEMVRTLAQEPEKNAVRRDYIPLQCKLKKGDKVDALLNIYGDTLLLSEKKSVFWQDSFTKCSFDFFVPKDIDVNELSCMVLLLVNEIPVGEMRFVTTIVDAPRELHPDIITRKYKKVFISYAHKDEEKVKSFHESLKVFGIDHFFDRDYLKAGDVFPQVIQDYINTADLFVLFWSENASKSEYVQKERMQALGRAFPQVKPQQAAKLSIYPMSIKPRAELPNDMKDLYHFGEL